MDTFDDNALTLAQTLFDHPEIAASLADSDRLDVDFVVSIDHGHLIASLQFGDGALWDEKRATRQIKFYSHACEFTGAERIARISCEPNGCQDPS